MRSCRIHEDLVHLRGTYEGTYKWSYKWLDSVKKWLPSTYILIYNYGIFYKSLICLNGVITEICLLQ